MIRSAPDPLCGLLPAWRAFLTASSAAVAATAEDATDAVRWWAAQGEEVGAGLLTYPALMAADILLYQVELPGWMGKDR